jgi:MscS family membrane protein
MFSSTVPTNWLDRSYGGVTVDVIVRIAALMAAVVMLRLVVTWIITTLIKRRFSGEELAFWSGERKRIDRAMSLIVVGVVSVVGAPLLDVDPDVESVIVRAGGFVAAVGVIVLAYRVVDVIIDVLARRAAETETKLDDGLVPLLRTVLRLAVTGIGLVFVLQNLDVNVSSLLTGLGLGGLAFALAAQDTAKNLFGGVTVFIDKPFEIGDWIAVDDIEGTVEAVGFRSTRIRTFYNSQVTVPNGRLVDTGVDNMGRREWRRYKADLGIGYHSTPDQVDAFVEGLRDLIRGRDGFRQDYFIVEFTGFGESSLDVMLYCFIDAPDWNAELRARHELNLDIMRLAQRVGVEFAFPTRTVHLAREN